MIVVIYIVCSILIGIWSVIRQTQRWSGNSILRLVSVFIINTIGAPVCLFISLRNRNFLPDGKPADPIETYKNIK